MQLLYDSYYMIKNHMRKKSTWKYLKCQYGVIYWYYGEIKLSLNHDNIPYLCRVFFYFIIKQIDWKLCTVYTQRIWILSMFVLWSMKFSQKFVSIASLCHNAHDLKMFSSQRSFTSIRSVSKLTAYSDRNMTINPKANLKYILNAFLWNQPYLPNMQACTR